MRTLYNTLQYLSGYYDHIIVLSVSKALSGTYNAWHQAIEKYPGIKEKVSLIDTKQNSVAQGLLAYKAQSYVKSGMAFNLIVDQIRKDIEASKIWVNIKTIDPMIASGRLSVKAGKIAKLVNLTPIVTLKEGAGAIEKIAFSQKGALKKLMKGLGEEHKNNEIMTYSITYIDDLASAQLFAKEAEAIIGFPPEYITESSSIIANGAGKGAIAIGMITRRSS
jgi:DegV family protein with EDD domain